MRDAQELIRTVTTKGQVTIPVEVRRLLGVNGQDKVVFRIIEGRVELQPATMTLEATFGSIAPRKHPEDFAELRNIAIEERVQHVIEQMSKIQGKDQSAINNP